VARGVAVRLAITSDPSRSGGRFARGLLLRATSCADRCPYDARVVSVRLADEADMARLTELAQAAPPGLISLPAEWTHRLGDGTGPHTGLTLVGSRDGGGLPDGFLWADNAMRTDQQMPLEWLCMNALYVDPEARDHGIGRALVERAIERARELDMTTVHGQCLPEVANWWRSLAFEVTDVDEEWPTPVYIDEKHLRIGSAGNCPLWMYLVPPTEIHLTSRGD